MVTYGMRENGYPQNSINFTEKAQISEIKQPTSKCFTTKRKKTPFKCNKNKLVLIRGSPKIVRLLASSNVNLFNSSLHNYKTINLRINCTRWKLRTRYSLMN
jgi:hypothetical protein